MWLLRVTRAALGAKGLCLRAPRNDLFNGDSEDFRWDWLAQHGDCAEFQCRRFNGGGGVAGHEYGRHRNASALQVIEDLNASQAGHMHIEHREIKADLKEQAQGLGAVGGR